MESYELAGWPFVDNRVLKASSDAEGRYRLTGMPEGKGNMILAVPNDNQPYLAREVTVPDAKGADPVTANVELHRGVWITGRVTAK